MPIPIPCQETQARFGGCDRVAAQLTKVPLGGA